jgi:uncharacterized protein with HEPN domain
MQNKDYIRIRHILDASEDAILFLKDKSKDDFKNDKILIYALVKALEIIGEAANLISTEIQDKFPEIPWRDMIDMRNFLVHEYFGINEEIVWNTVKIELPKLLTAMKKVKP